MQVFHVFQVLQDCHIKLRACLQVATEESANAAAEQLLAAEDAAAAQAKAKKTKKQRQKAKKQRLPHSFTPEEPHQSEQTQNQSTQGESAQAGDEMGPSVKAQHAQGAAKAQHAQGAAKAQHAQDITAAQQLPDGLQDNQAEASLAEFAPVSKQLHVQLVQHKIPEIHAETSAMDVLDELLQSAAAQAMTSGSCQESSPSQAVSTSSKRMSRSLFCCPVRKVWYAHCGLCCLLHPDDV